MKEYILTIIGATLLSVLADIVSPEQWRKYIQLLTGLVIVSCILTPAFKIADLDLFSGFELSDTTLEEGETLQKELVASELEQRVAEDAKQRIASEFHCEAEVEAEVLTDEQMQITGVKRIRIHGKNLPEGIAARIKEVYGTKNVEVDNE